jgi:hypothetical protein
MTTVRQELETRLATFASSQSPPLKVAFEDLPFTKPTTPYLECFIAKSNTLTVTVDANRTRELGVMQVNVWTPTGKGAGVGEVIADKIIAAFPVIPIVGTVCIVSPASFSRAIIDESGWRILPITIMYRHEGEVVPT